LADKHSGLSESEIAATVVGGELGQRLAAMAAAGCRGPVLDWGCGRGRSVLRLRDDGFQAWGVDVDHRVLEQSRPALARRGLDEQAILRSLEHGDGFPEASFQLIFSEETLEHVQDLDAVAHRMFALTAPGGWGIHSFPGGRRWREPHLHLPLVHWLGKGTVQERFIHLALRWGWNPPTPWPEVQGLSDPRDQARVYAGYLQRKTYYRDIQAIIATFRAAGFEADYRYQGRLPLWGRLTPSSWRNNGFPEANLLLLLHRPANTPGVPAP